MAGAEEVRWVDGPRIYPLFGLNERTVREAANDGEVVRRYVGRKPLYRVDSIHDWIDAQPADREAS